MEYEKYYDKRANGYVVHFPNNKCFTLEEITEMFSAFGKIVSVNVRGKNNGLCFIRYETVEDVKKCIDGFRNNSSIKILPHKLKNNNNTNIKTSKDVDTDAQKKSQDKRMFKQNTSGINSSGENNHLTTYSLSIKQSQNTQTNNQSDSNLSESPGKDNFNDDIHNENKTNYHSSIQISSLKQNIRLKNLEKFASNTSISSAATNNTSKELNDILDETNIPALVHIDQKYGTLNITPSSVKIVPAHEVIVANIHSSLTIHYILHLFEKFNPISISLMMRLPKTNILYCHVYFKTYEEAYATMKQFDMHNVHGKKLIVLTSNKLMEEISQL